jgi:hypothetical protein
MFLKPSETGRAQYAHPGYRDTLARLQSTVGFESDVVDVFEEILSPDWRVEREVPGRDSDGRRFRIDALLWPTKFLSKPVGFEAKRYGGVGALTRAIGQAVDYAGRDVKFYPKNHPGSLRVVTSVLDLFTASMTRLECQQERDFVDRLCGRLNVGFWRVTSYHGLAFFMSGHPVWSQRSGRQGTHSLEPKTGAR